MKTKYFGSFNYLLIVIIIFASIINIKSKSFALNFFIIIFEVISIIICHIYHKRIEKKVLYNKTIRQIIAEINIDKNKKTIQSSRKQVRFGLITLTTASTALSLYWTLLLKNIWIFILSIAVLWIANIYADYIPHIIYFAKQYDYLFTKDVNNTNSFRGLARIFKDEYKKSDEFSNKEFYKSLQPYSYSTNCRVQDKCIKSILFVKADSLIYPMNIYNIVILFFNIFLTVPNLFESSILILLSNLHLNYTEICPYVLLFFNILFGTLNIVTSTLMYEKVGTIKEIYDAINNGNSKDRFNVYKKIRTLDGKKKFDVIEARGIFLFCSTIINKNQKLDKIDLKYRLLYRHLYSANKPRFCSTFWFSIIIILIVAIDYQFSIYSTLIIIQSFVILTLFSYLFVLPNLEKRILIKHIKEL